MCLQRQAPSRSELTSSADQLRVSELVGVAELASRRWQAGFGWVSVYGVFVPPGPFPPTWDAWDDCYSSSMLHKTVKQMKQRDLRSPSTGEGRRETGTEKKKKRNFMRAFIRNCGPSATSPTIFKGDHLPGKIQSYHSQPGKR